MCAHARPVLHRFFLEHWPCAGDWFTARLRYTRSTALSSMAGYVIGLGDRHCANILLDVHSGEAVHIDLGVAFEQGRFLHTPEVVPFRLTRSVVDGMGAMGVEGAMARCSVAAMRVLREHAPELLTIVEVLLHDPLYHWVLTPLQAGQRQTDRVDQLDDGPCGGVLFLPSLCVYLVNAVDISIQRVLHVPTIPRGDRGSVNHAHSGWPRGGRAAVDQCRRGAGADAHQAKAGWHGARYGCGDRVTG